MTQHSSPNTQSTQTHTRQHHSTRAHKLTTARAPHGQENPHKKKSFSSALNISLLLCLLPSRTRQISQLPVSCEASSNFAHPRHPLSPPLHPHPKLLLISDSQLHTLLFSLSSFPPPLACERSTATTSSDRNCVSFVLSGSTLMAVARRREIWAECCCCYSSHGDNVWEGHYGWNGVVALVLRRLSMVV